MTHNLPRTRTPPTRADVRPDAQDDQRLALLLTIIWAARTGRVPPRGPVSELSAGELMDFWADDQFEHPHAAGGQNS